MIRELCMLGNICMEVIYMFQSGYTFNNTLKGLPKIVIKIKKRNLGYLINTVNCHCVLII